MINNYQIKLHRTNIYFLDPIKPCSFSQCNNPESDPLGDN